MDIKKVLKIGLLVGLCVGFYFTIVHSVDLMLFGDIKAGTLGALILAGSLFVGSIIFAFTLDSLIGD